MLSTGAVADQKAVSGMFTSLSVERLSAHAIDRIIWEKACAFFTLSGREYLDYKLLQL